MSGDVVLVIHVEADEPLAREVTRELSKFAAIPTQLSEAKPARVGVGAIGVVIWTSTLALAFPECVLENLAQDAVIFWVGGAVPASTGRLIEAGANGDNGEALRTAVTEEQAARSNARQLVGHGGVEGLAPAAAAYAARGAGGRLAVQSASGLAAALAVVGIVTPMIGGSPGAEGNEVRAAGLSLVGEAQAASGRVTPVSTRASVVMVSQPVELALSVPTLVEEGSLADSIARHVEDSTPQHVGSDTSYVEILANGAVASGFDGDLLEIVASGDSVGARIETRALVPEFAASSGVELLIAEDQDFNFYHRFMGPPD